MDDSAITCDKVIEPYDEDAENKSYDEIKTMPTNYKQILKTINKF